MVQPWGVQENSGEGPDLGTDHRKHHLDLGETPFLAQPPWFGDVGKAQRERQGGERDENIPLR